MIIVYRRIWLSFIVEYDLFLPTSEYKQQRYHRKLELFRKILCEIYASWSITEKQHPYSELTTLLSRV